MNKAVAPAELRSGAPSQANSTSKPRSDLGTIVIHWLTVVAMVASLFTGLRISADARTAVFAKWIAPILPQGEVWTVHFLAGLALFFCLTAYVLYLVLGGLLDRNAPRRMRALALPGSTAAARKARWGGVNVLLHWFIYAVVLIMTGTGIALYLGFGGWVVWLHATCALIALGYIAIHMTTHFLYGGWQQLLRLFRPAALTSAAASRKPLLIASLVGIPVITGLAAVDVATRDHLDVRPVNRAPDLAKLLDDDVWKTARPVTIRTMQGINLKDGSGESTVEIRAVRDEARIYFAFRWEDPSRSTRRLPMIKREDGWHLLGDSPFIDDVTTFYEDKFAVIFSTSDAFGSGGVSHLGPKPHPDFPGSRNGRGLHYTDGHMVDMWQWKASRGGLLGEVDDMYIGPPRQPTQNEAAQLNRYQAGYWGDPGDTPYTYNFKLMTPADYKGGPVTPLKLPKDHVAMTRAMGTWNDDPNAGTDDGSKWWMLPQDTVDYTAEADAKVPVGTIMPAVLITGNHSGDRYDLKGAADWRDGHWTLIVSRALKSESKYDASFVPGTHLYMWVGVFDHTQTRHTRHTRPVVMDVR